MTRTGRNTRVFAAMVALVMLFVLAAPAFAATSEQVEATRALNVRSGPGTNYSIVGELKSGQVVTRVGTSGNWSIIELSGRRVYVYSSYLRVTNNSSGGSTTDTTTLYTTGRANVRSGPGTGFRVLTTLNKGDSVSRIGTVGSWTIIEWNGGTAYISTSLLTSQGGGNSGGSTNPATGTMEATTNVNVRSGPSTSFSKLGALRTGERVTRTGTVGNWTQITYNGRTAYVHSSYLRLVNSGDGNNGGNETSSTGYVEITTRTAVRSGAGTNFGSFATLSRGDIVQRTGISGTWTKVDYRGRTGYVLTSAVKTYSSSASLKRYVVADSFLYNSASSQFGVVTTLRAGSEVTLLDTISGWSRVTFGRFSGYIEASNLSSNSVDVNATGLVYALRYIAIYSQPTTSSTRMGFMDIGESLERTGTLSGGWTQVLLRGRTGYVQTSNVIAFTSSSQTQFTRENTYMYSNSNGTPAYIIPEASRTYQGGTLEYNEPVLRVAYNSTWSIVYVENVDQVYYVPTIMLKTTI